MWKKLKSNFNFTCVCKSEKQSFIFLNTSLFNWEHIDELSQESEEAVPNLLCSHKDVSLSLEGREAMFPISNTNDFMVKYRFFILFIRKLEYNALNYPKN